MWLGATVASAGTEGPPSVLTSTLQKEQEGRHLARQREQPAPQLPPPPLHITCPEAALRCLCPGGAQVSLAWKKQDPCHCPGGGPGVSHTRDVALCPSDALPEHPQRQPSAKTRPLWECVWVPGAIRSPPLSFPAASFPIAIPPPPPHPP